MIKKLKFLVILIAFSSCVSNQQRLALKQAHEVPAGEYVLDKTHASLIFKVNHLGFSNYTARFKKFDAKLQFEPLHPTKSSIEVTVDPKSLETDYPNLKPDFNKQLQGFAWLDAKKFPEIKFKSTKIELVGINGARVIGDLEMHGVKKPVSFDVKFNGGYASHPLDPMGARIGFSALGKLKRSDFGIAFGIPAAGSNMGVGDEVEFIIEVEFVKKNK